MPAIAVLPDVHLQGATRVIPIDNSKALGHTAHAATSPNLLASFIRICAGESIETQARATSQAFYVIRGSGGSASSTGEHGLALQWGAGDLFVLPATSGPVKHTADAAASGGDVSLYWIHDEPLLRYLGVAPCEAVFKPTLYTRDALLAEVERIRHEPGVEHRNRMGVLLSNAATDGETKTLTHVLWALLNTLPPHTAQPPHRHNSVALDLAVDAAQGKVYTLMGPELGADGWVKDPIRMDWTAGGMFVTPPGERERRRGRSRRRRKGGWEAEAPRLLAARSVGSIPGG